MRLPRGRLVLVVLAGVLLLAWVVRELAAPPAPAAGDAAIVEAFEAQRSGVMVESVGTVERLLAAAEAHDDALMGRALQVVGQTLVRHGLPVEQGG